MSLGTQTPAATFSTSSMTAPTSTAGSMARNVTRRLGSHHDGNAHAAALIATVSTARAGASHVGKFVHQLVRTALPAKHTPIPTIHTSPRARSISPRPLTPQLTL